MHTELEASHNYWNLFIFRIIISQFSCIMPLELAIKFNKRTTVTNMRNLQKYKEHFLICLLFNTIYVFLDVIFDCFNPPTKNAYIASKRNSMI